MPITPVDILKDETIPHNDGSLRVILYWCLYHDILTFPEVPASPTAYDAAITIEEDIVMKTGKKYQKREGTLEANGLDFNIVAERDGRSAENIHTLQHPGSNPKLQGFLEWHKNSSLVFIAQHIDGTMKLIGSPGLPASIDTGEGKGGLKVADSRHIKFTVKSVGRIAAIYKGDVPLTPAA